MADKKDLPEKYGIKKTLFVFLMVVIALVVGICIGLRISDNSSGGDNFTERDLFLLNIQRIAELNKGKPLEQFVDAFDRVGYRAFTETGYVKKDGEKINREWIFIKLVVDGVDGIVVLPNEFHNEYFPAEKIT